MTYNGHPSRRLWSLALNMANIETLYFTAKDLLRSHTKDEAARILSAALDGQTTAEGYRWSVSGTRYALRHL